MAWRAQRAGMGLGDAIVWLLVIGLAVAWVLPVIWVIGLSLKPNDVLMRTTDRLFAPPFTWQNYRDILAGASVFRWMTNSAIVAGGQTVLTLVIASLAGYGFARTNFRFRRPLFIVTVAAFAVPDQAIIVPLHTMFAFAHLHNTYLALILPHVANPFGVILMTQYFRAITPAIEEAALLDNASRTKIFLQIMLPLSLPAQATLGIYTFLHAWNEYFWPLVSATKPEMYTLTVGLASMQTNFAQVEGLGFLMAQAVFAGLPVFILYIFFQKYIVNAVAGGAAVQ